MRFFQNGKIRELILVVADYISILIACVCSLAIFVLSGLMGTNRAVLYDEIIPGAFIYSLVVVISMAIFGVYRVIWRYARLREFFRCVGGVVLGTMCYTVVSKILGVHTIPELMFAFSGIVGIIYVILIRMAYISIFNYISYRVNRETKNKVMIIGAGNAGKHICEQMQTNKKNYNPVVFIDDDSNKIGRIICGVPVAGNTNEIVKIASKYNVSEIILAISSISTENKKRILNICSETFCKVSILPKFEDYIHSDKLNDSIKEVKIEDLLGRDAVKFDTDEISEMIRNKVCMITGGGGSIGSELSRQIAKMRPKKLVIVDIYENNAYDIQQELVRTYSEKLDLSVQIASVRDRVKMRALFDEFKPDLVFHAAAHKHVPLMETNPEEAIKNNIFGTFSFKIFPFR